MALEEAFDVELPDEERMWWGVPILYRSSDERLGKCVPLLGSMRMEGLQSLTQVKGSKQDL